MTNQNEKYSINNLINLATEGMDGELRALGTRICIALHLNRIPIITPFHTNPIHNFGLTSNHCRWEKYIDLDKTKIYRRKENEMLRKELFPLRWIASEDFNMGPYPQKEIREITQEQLYDKENEKYKILFLDSYFDPQPPFFIKFVASQAVNELTDIVLRRFGTSRAAMSSLQDLFNNRCNTAPLLEKIKHEKFFYSCLHVRGNDALLIGLVNFHSTQPKHIKKLVYSACPRDTKLYIMSDIHNTRYFDFLRDRYDVYTYHDFPELKQLVSNENGPIDNNMLFMVEKNIMNHAIVKIAAPYRYTYHFQSDFKYNVPALTRYTFKGIGNNTFVSLDNKEQVYKLTLFYKVIATGMKIIDRITTYFAKKRGDASD